MEPWSCRGDDVAVRLRLGQINGLLFLEHKEAVELCSSLFLVIVSAQLEQADGLGTSFSHHTLLKKNMFSASISSHTGKYI